VLSGRLVQNRLMELVLSRFWWLEQSIGLLVKRIGQMGQSGMRLVQSGMRLGQNTGLLAGLISPKLVVRGMQRLVEHKQLLVGRDKSCRLEQRLINEINRL
jgi:hypothetical protein